jgi:4-alpha-glucanotransferase
MEFPGFDHYLTGVLVPVAALRTEHSCGVGEFADLPELATWCRDNRLDLIQILPVNDTGYQSSPYSALSAFALHPIYIRIADMPEYAVLSSEVRAEVDAAIAELRSEQESRERFQYPMVISAKQGILRQIFHARLDAVRDDPGLWDWVEANPWVRVYAAYRTLKDRHEQRPWMEWTELRDPDAADIDALWSRPSMTEDLIFYAWLQYRLEEQLTSAAAAVNRLGVKLKGDLPILMDEDSADIWRHRDIFIPELRAGAPPDMFSRTGQNWGFPVYDWDVLAKEDYDWWKRRLMQADKFYHAFRIDHVLGFFRIWSIPAADLAGTMGYFYPSFMLSREALHEAGFDDGRIAWLAQPHIRGETLRTEFGAEAQRVAELALDQVGDEDLFKFGGKIAGERELLELELSGDAIEKLRALYWDRALIETGNERFAPAWEFRSCSRYQELPDEEKDSFEGLVGHVNRVSEEMWEEQGRRLLSFMSTTVPMLPCAEDLGVIPESVPRTLQDLGILGLRVPRWAREWDEPGQPYIPVEDYPFLTVSAPSVHDTSTIREWWEHEGEAAGFWRALGFSGEAPKTFDPETAHRVYRKLAESNAAILVFQLQDYLVFDSEITPEEAADERINIPGTSNEFNWTYRMPVTIETLRRNTAVSRGVGEVTGIRAAKEIPATVTPPES